MAAFNSGKFWIPVGIVLGTWLGLRYLMPIFLPFLLGLLVALAAEPVVNLGVRHLKLPRWLSSGIGVSVTLILLFALLWLLGALAVRELGQLAGAIPDLSKSAQQGIALLQDWLVGIADRSPEGLRSLLTGLILELSGSGTVLFQQLAARLPGFLTSVLGKIPDSAVGLGTGILAGFMISARLPRLKAGLSRRMPPVWKEKYLPALARLRKALFGWLKAQAMLIGITYLIVTAGLLLLKIPYAPLWALLIALVDAVPILGTGTVMIPWGIVSLLQGQSLQGLGLFVIYGIAAITRTVLEPRLVGRQLGLDPLLTLIFFYVGYRFWGIFGMLLAPMLATAAKSLTDQKGI